MNCIGYLRVSTERQAGEVFTSLADQEKAIREKAEKLGLEVGAWYRDEGASGATVEGRPAFKEMLDYCESHPQEDEGGTVLVLNDSRFGRFPDPEEAAYWRIHLRKLGWIVRFVEGDETEDLTGRTVMRALKSAEASEYRANIRRNARRGMRGAAEQGFWTRRAPYGFRRQVVYPELGRVLEPGEHKSDNEKVKLTPDEDEAVHVRWAYEQYASGALSMTALADELQTRVPQRNWRTTVVRAMFKNPAYCGDVIGGKRTDDDETYGMRDAHEAIVPRELWEKVQEKLGRTPAKKKPSIYLLTGIMQCPHCEHTYYGGGGGKDRKFYVDRGGKEGDCEGRIGTIMRYMVDDATVDTLAETIGSTEVQESIARELDRVLSLDGTDKADAELRKALKKATKMRDRLVSLLADGTLLKKEATPKLEAIRAEIEDLETRRDRVRFDEKRKENGSELKERILEMARDFPATAKRLRDEGMAKALRRLVTPWIDSATFDKLTRELTLYIKPAPTLAANISPGPGSP